VEIVTGRVGEFFTSSLYYFLWYIKYNCYLFRTQIYADLRRKLFHQIIKCLTFNFQFSAKIKFYHRCILIISSVNSLYLKS